MSYLEKMDRYLDSLKVGKSALVDSWFMMSSPVPILSVVVAYLILIRIGPRIMKNRPPLMLNRLITYYNASQVILAVFMCYKVSRLNMLSDGFMYMGCRYPSNTQNLTLLEVGWWYFFAKFTELLDTVFFILRKKNKQITFLHVYHHAVMALYSWSYLKFAAGGEGAVLALLNSTVHVVMYSYYLLSGLGPRIQKYLWWKKYVTKMQLLQFTFMLGYCAWTHFSPRCQFAAGFTYFICTNISIFLFLFLNFYSKNYKKKSIKEKEKENKKETEHSKGQNGVTNGVHKNGATCKENGKMENGNAENGNAENGNAKLDNDDKENLPFEVNKACGDYIKDGKVFLTRRTAKAAYGTAYDFESIIKK